MAGPHPDLRAIFCEALARKTSAEQAEYLDQACQGNAPLLARVESLLRAHREAGSFLQGSSAGHVAPGEEQTAGEGLGTVIGSYKLLEQIGEGGFGVVYMAEQRQPVRRKVALKVLKPGMDTRQVIARFEAERQALALMDHPNIAHVFDAGTTDTGRPYFVMELVRGIPITAYCDQSQLTIDERLKLFVVVCQAMQHAHQKGIIHRDVKPSNVLVTLYDGTPVPKVIDFGIAKAISGPLTDKTLFTGFTQMLGTPLYMSPEQTWMNGLDIDTRTDIYALGVLLYELLTGTTPFDKERLEKAGFDELRQIIQEEEPPQPSTRISTLLQTATTVWAQRKTDPKRLGQLVRGDLDWIVMKALEKDRNQRYGTVSSFAADVERHLKDEPVKACPPSVAYQLRKFARRNKVILLTAALVTAALVLAVVGLAVSTWLIWRAQQRTDEQRLRAEEAVEREHHLALEARQQRQTAEELLARSQLERGVRLLEADNSLGLLDILLARSTAERIPRVRDSLPILWAGWHQTCAGRLVYVLSHQGPVVAVAFSPDGQWLATASKDSTARVWSTTSGLPVGSPLRHQADVWALAFSPDGKLLATGSQDGTARLWDPATGLPHGPSLPSGGGSVNAVAFSPDGKWLLTAVAPLVPGSSPDENRVIPVPGGAVQLWDPATGLRHGPPLQYQQEHWAVAFSPDGKLLAAASGNTVQLWDPTTGRPHGQPLRHAHTVQLVAFSPDGELLAAATPGSVQLWKTTTGLPHGPVMRFPRWAKDLKFSPDGRRLAAASVDWNVYLWETATGAPHGQLLRHENRVQTMAFSPDGKRLATVSLDTTARLWDPATGGPVGPPLRHQGIVHAVAFSPDGKLLATASEDGAARLWLTASPVHDQPLRHDKTVFAVAFSPDSKLLATASEDGAVQLWDVASGQPRHGLPLRHQDVVRSMAFSPDGQLLATGSDDCTTQLWDSTIRQRWGQPIKHPDRVTAVAFSPDSKLLAVGLRNGPVQFWEPITGQPRGKAIGKEEQIKALAFSPDGKLLAAGSKWEAQLWDLVTGEPWRRPLRRGGRVRGVAFSPDGKLWAIGSEDGITQLWDLTTGQPDSLPLRHQAEVWDVAFSPDGKLLASASLDNTVRLWDLTTEPPRHSFPLRHQGLVRSVAFSPDGQLLATAPADRTARLWRLPRAPADLREMQLRTWVALGARYDANGDVEPIPWQQWRELRQELQTLEEQRQATAGQ